MPKRKEESDDPEDEDEEDLGSKKSAKTKAKATPRKKKVALAPAPSITEDGWHLHPPSFMFKQFGEEEPSAKIAAIDLDGTMVNQKTTNKYGPKDSDDWKWYNKKTVPQALKGFAADGFRLVMITNQGSIKSKFDGANADKVRGRISNVVNELGLPMLVLIATEATDKENGNLFRKPATGMWQHLQQHLNGGVEIDLGASFFVGDAAGRPGDFAASDKEMAAAVGIAFKVPEDVFGEMEGKKHAPTQVKGVAVPPPSAAFAEGSSPNEALISAFNTAAAEFIELGDPPGVDWFKSNKFRASHSTKVATALKSFPGLITLQNLKEVGKLPGVGKATITSVKTWLETGSLRSESEEAALGPVAVAAPSKAAQEAAQYM